MRNIVAFGLGLLAFTAQGTGSAQAAPFIVEKGQPRAEIIIADSPPRTVRLAARELQNYVLKISGATLPVTNAPGSALPVKIYIGRSAHTDKLGVKPYDIKDGGYRIVSGDTWLALLGRDDDFTPIEPWPHNRADWTSGRVTAEWDKLTGDAKWGNPMGGIYKSKAYFDVAPSAVVPANEQRDRKGLVQLWAFDERGSFNGVCDFLRRLGVRWYMPGELGEVVPTLATIPLPTVDETVRPAFPLRQFCLRYNGRTDDTLWTMRLGLRDVHGVMIAHGLALMAGRPEFQAAHTDYFALYGGKRDNQPDVEHKRQLCLSSEALFKETVAWARAVFDHYKFDAVSVWPADGFSAICQCPLCKGKDSPERKYSGRLSDYVWDYVNRVAKEVAKTHPDKKILCGAYGIYTLPPLKIDKLHSNVVVCIVGGRRPTANKPEQQEEFRQLRESWLPKTANPLMNFENYPFTGRGWTMPSFVPQAMGESINATKPYSMGEDIWFSAGLALHAPEFNHFNLYFTARMYWDNDVDKLYREYCRLFYGPAEQEMKAFFDYCEANWQAMQDDSQKAARVLELFAAAEKKAEAGSVYGKRIALLAAYLKGFKARSEQLAQPRDDRREQRLWDNATGITLDGKLDEPFWKSIPAEAVGHLSDLMTSNAPVHKTNFKVGWEGDNLCFAIRCEDAGTLNIGTTRNEDPALWFGDAVEVLLETDKHSYYQFAINPAGAMADLDRALGKGGFEWESQAEVAVVKGATGWTIEMRIPVTQDENDPLHQVIGSKPTAATPWHFNICRQRPRDKESELTAFSPTGTKGFHVVRKFGKLYVK